MKEDVKQRVQTIQASMIDSARPGFSESELDNLRVVIRLTIEFEDYLRDGIPDLKKTLNDLKSRIGFDLDTDTNQNEAEYCGESTFSGIESFVCVSNAYGCLTGKFDSKVNWGIASTQAMQELFTTLYRDFIAEKDFLRKCRLLLDLFKVQIVWTGLSYG